MRAPPNQGGANAIVLGLKSRTKPDVITELVHFLAQLVYIKQEEEAAVSQGILARERLASTALGNGVAFPHCRSSLTEKLVGVLGIEPVGIPFGAVDGESVRCSFLFLAPLDRREELYNLVGRIAAIGGDKSRSFQLRGCRTAEAAHQLLCELDNQ